MRKYRVLLLTFALVLGQLALAGQKPSSRAAQALAAPAFDLTIDNIMRGPGLFGNSPSGVRWSSDSRMIYFQWKKFDEPREKNLDTYVVNADSTGLRRMTEEEARDAAPLNADWTRDKRRAVFADGGDLYLYDFNAGKRRALTRTSEAETNPRFTRDQEHVTFTRAGNLYLLSLQDGSLVQMTDVQAPGAAPAAAPPGGPVGRGGQGQFQGRGGVAAAAGSSEQRGTDSQEFVKKEERDLLDIIKRRAAKREEDEAKRKKDNPRKPFALQARQTVTSLQLSPDQKMVIAVVSESGEGTKNSIVPNFVTESTYVEDIPGRSLVGDSQARTRIALIDVATGEVKWVDHGQKPVTKEAAPDAAAPPPGSAAQDTAQGQTPRRSPAPAEREVQLFPPVWSEDGTRAVLVGRAADNKDRWIFALDPSTGKTRLLFSDHDNAWINQFGGGGPGGGSANMGWMKDDRSIYFLSERSGYSHLYVVPYDGGEVKALTTGNWEVAAAQLSEDKNRFFLTTTEPDPSDRHFFVMPASGGERTRITTAAGHHQAAVSPDEKKLAVIYSFTTKPPDLYVQDLQPGAKPVQATNSPAPDFWNYPWSDAPIVQVPARDGAMVPGRMYKPKNWKPGGPGVIFVHGAGYAQNVHRGWSGNPQVNLFNHFLMEHGYLVMDLDYRASAGYGRDWRTAIYRHMGGKDLDDQVDCARWMASAQGVDPRRIGIYGGSYGGFMTLMAMFTQPDVFAAGAALRPVTDWAHYNHGYTANILNTPQKDAEAYRQSSPIYFAQNLKGALLICHGMVDTNVFFQDSVRLVQRLIELRKENWEFALYPVEDHGFLEPTSWADEYKRIFRLFEANLKKPSEAGAKGTKKAT
jgi:dipeptidyl aminopeptidase/acylaminoacyl peptidase